MTDLVRGTILDHYAALVSELGGNFLSMAAKEGVDASAIGDSQRFIPYSKVAALVGAAVKEFNCPDFGLRLGCSQSIQILGPLAVLFRHSETIGDSVDGISRYLYMCAPPDVAQLRRGPRTAAFVYSIALRHLPHRDQMVEKTFAVAVNAFRQLLGNDFNPVKVTLQHRRLSSPERYFELFRCPMEFGRDENAIFLPMEVLRRPVSGRDAAALELAKSYLALSRPDISLADQIREMISRLMKIHRATLVTVAESLALHPRVLQRQLFAAGTSFEAILDDERRVMALQLSAAGLRISQIATTLGYSEQSSYVRACRRWYGVAPRQLILQSKTPLDS
ncbi:AraC family transcriptional regulator ligand-binding domain-containing protein (plasmid) [Agrobacterium leguminum]|uniref:AraC family transcriptional regulator n=1 Tax=Agrobacterium leguminum TaxID=2792015 RepID=UPI0030CC0229